MEKHSSDSAYLRSVIDAIPTPIFVVDGDVRILDTNRAAAQMISDPPEVVLRRMCGEVLHCLYESQSTKGCGKTRHCPDCVVRNAVKEAVKGKQVVRKKTEMKLDERGEVRQLQLLITTAPFEYNGASLILLTLEDVTELFALRGLIPICAHCKKVRNEEEFWESVEHYLRKYKGIQFTHGLCPECMETQYPEYKD